MSARRDVRTIALAMLREYEELGKYVNLQLSSHMADPLTREERSLLTALLYTTVEHKITYDYYIAAFAGRSIDKIDPTTKNILRLGMCQLFDMRGIPAHAAVNESVKLARNKGERAFVNGILRTADRARGGLPVPDRAKNNARYLSVRYSFPLWIVKKYLSVFGETEGERLLERLSEVSPTDITVNTLKISREALIAKLRDDGIVARPSPYSEVSVRIAESVDPRYIPGFDEGEFFVQDSSCAAAVSVLSPEGGDLLIDVCACPGGKSFAAAMLMRDTGSVRSLDIHAAKLSLIESGVDRLGLSSVSVGEVDARHPIRDLLGKADKVICDVPCSGLGVLAKKPDLRYRSEAGVAELPELQLEILTASASYLRVGGRMIYSTCTLLPQENQEVVKKFLSENPGYSAVNFKIGDAESVSGCFTFLPHVHGTDGFFVSLIERKA